MTKIDNDDHPVEVGLADAFYIDEVVSDSDGGSRTLLAMLYIGCSLTLGNFVGGLQ